MRRRSFFLIGLFTTSDNKSGDIGRIVFFMFSVACISLSAWHGGCDPITWAAGAGGIMASGVASLALKRHTEPEGGAGRGS